MKNTFLALIAILSLVACSSDDDSNEETTQAHRLVFDLVEDYNSISLTTTINYSDNINETIESDFDVNTTSISVTIPENAISFNLIFYNEDSDLTNIKFFGVEDNVIIYEDDIEQQIFEYSYTF